MGTISRRDFLALASSFGASLAWRSRPAWQSRAAWGERRDLYPQGVASGDPDAHSVILWTRRAPEVGAAAYRLALEQKADFVEPDLAVTKDGVLICLHDDTLERTTNIADVFPDRPSAGVPGRGPDKRWLANDFTLAEIRRLDAGRWFDQKYAGLRILTFQE